MSTSLKMANVREYPGRADAAETKAKLRARISELASTPSLVQRAVGVLTFAERSARTHSEAQVAQIAASITEYGFTNPVLIDENNSIIAGEGRVRAARKLNMAEVPCIVIAHLTAEQKAAYLLADNKLALNAGWDDELLQAELLRLAELDIDLSLAGFSDVEFLSLCDLVDFDMTETVVVEPSESDEPRAPHEPARDAPVGKSSPTEHWQGMPDFRQPSNLPHRTLLVHFDTQAHVEAFAALIEQNLTDKTKYIWFPKQVTQSSKEVVYA